jgi:hypothetical protein
MSWCLVGSEMCIRDRPCVDEIAAYKAGTAGHKDCHD